MSRPGGARPRRGRLLCLLAAAAVLALSAVGCGSEQDGGAAPGTAGSGGALVARGRQVFVARGCAACHESADTPLGPSLTGLAGSTVTLTDGTTVVVDEAHLRRAITDPGAQVVAGWEGSAMPAYDLPEDQLAALVAYLLAGRADGS